MRRFVLVVLGLVTAIAILISIAGQGSPIGLALLLLFDLVVLLVMISHQLRVIGDAMAGRAALQSGQPLAPATADDAEYKRMLAEEQSKQATQPLGEVSSPKKNPWSRGS